MSNELIDILNPDGTPTGQSVDRETAHQQGLWHAAAHVWIVNQEHEVLLQLRAATKRAYPTTWEISVGEHVQAGETSADAARRGTREELGLNVPVTAFQLVLRATKELTVPNVGIDNEWNDVFLVERDVDLAATTLDPSEVANVRWVPLAELDHWYKDKPADFYPHPDEWPQMIALLQERYRRQ